METLRDKSDIVKPEGLLRRMARSLMNISEGSLIPEYIIASSTTPYAPRGYDRSAHAPAIRKRLEQILVGSVEISSK